MKSPGRAVSPLLLLAALPLLLAAAPSPSASPPPFVKVNPASGSPGTPVTITGGFFRPGQGVGLYFDSPNSPLGSAVPDNNGNINDQVLVPNANPGSHTVCAAVNVQEAPCAQFQVTAPPPTPTPTPEPTPSPTDTSSPSPSPTASPSSIAGVGTGSSGGGLLGSLFPAILIPIALLLAAGGVALYLILRNRGSGGGAPRPPYRGVQPQPPRPPRGSPGQMTVTHRTPPPPPASGQPQPPVPPGGPPQGGWGPPPPRGPRGDDQPGWPPPDD